MLAIRTNINVSMLNVNKFGREDTEGESDITVLAMIAKRVGMVLNKVVKRRKEKRWVLIWGGLLFGVGLGSFWGRWSAVGVVEGLDLGGQGVWLCGPWYGDCEKRLTHNYSTLAPFITCSVGTYHTSRDLLVAACCFVRL